ERECGVALVVGVGGEQDASDQKTTQHEEELDAQAFQCRVIISVEMNVQHAPHRDARSASSCGMYFRVGSNRGGSRDGAAALCAVFFTFSVPGQSQSASKQRARHPK